MIELLKSYSLSEIIIFFIIFCLAVKESISFYDWYKNRIQQSYNKNLKEKEDKDNVQKELDDMKKMLAEKEKIFSEKKEEISIGFKQINNNIDYLMNRINILIDSDKDDIKAFITREHHYFCYQKGWIDDYSLDCIEKRFEHYRQEKGNSFAETLMNELRALPKQPPQK
jgi:hypothetical protein